MRQCAPSGHLSILSWSKQDDGSTLFAIVEVLPLTGPHALATMVPSDIPLNNHPGSRHQIARALFGPDFRQDQLDALQQYFAYYNEELDLLRKGISKESWQTTRLAIKTHEDIFYVIDVLRRNAELRRPEIRQQLLERFNSSDDLCLDRSINLAIRLWLMINVQDAEFGGLRHEATCVQWDDESRLRDFLQSLFPRSRWQISAQSSRLGPHFTAAFMQRVCGLTIEWTTSLHDHLLLDRRRKALKVYPYKCHLQALIESEMKSNDKKGYVWRIITYPVVKTYRLPRRPIPLSVLEETRMSLDLLFPFWDDETKALLGKEEQGFHEQGPFKVTTAPTLLDFEHWRDRLLELYEEIFQSPPVSWAQLWRDRRSPQQFWTFWIAIMILILTLFSTIASIVQAWASVKALGRMSS